MGASVRPVAAGFSGDTRISENVRKMRDGGATSDEIMHYLRDVEGIASHGSSGDFGGPEDAPKVGKVEGMVRRGLNAATFGYGDEMSSAIDGAVAAATGPESYGQAHDRILAERRGRMGAFSAQHPALDTAAGLAGAIVAPVPGAGAVKGAGMLARLARTAGTGAVAGALTAAGEADEGDRTGAALRGGAAGAIAGPVAGALGAGVARGGKALASKIASRGGEEAVDAGDRYLFQRLSRSGQALTDVNADAERRIALGQPATLLESGGTEMQRTARGVRTVGGGGADEMMGALDARRAAAPARIKTAAERGLGAAKEDVASLAGDIAERRAQLAQPWYARAFQREPVVDESLDKLVQRPSLQAALKRGARMAAEEGEDLSAPGMALVVPGQGPQRGYTMKELHYAKLALDDMLDAAKRGHPIFPEEGGTGPTGRRLIAKTKDELLAIMDAHAPEYANARNIWAGGSAFKSALEDGLSAMTADPDELAQTFAKLSDGERYMYRKGAVKALFDRLDTAADAEAGGNGQNVLAKAWGNPAMRKRLEIMFPSKQAFAEYAEQMSGEADMVRARNAAVSGSNTMDKAQDVADIGGVPLDIASDVLSGGPRAALKQMAKGAMLRASRQMTRTRADAIAPKLSAGAGGDPAQLRAVLQRLFAAQEEASAREAAASAGRRRAAAVTGVAVGALTGRREQR